MAKTTLQDATIYYGYQDLSGDVNEITLSAEAEALDCTNFGSAGWKEFVGGLKTGNADLTTFLQDTNPAEPDLVLETYASGAPLLVSPNNPIADEDTTFHLEPIRAQYNRRFQVGQLWGADVSFPHANRPLLRGQALHVATDESATGQGTAYQVGSVAVGQKVYGTLVVTQLDGTLTSLDVKIASDSDSGFSTSPEDQITFTQITSTGATFEIGTPVSGAITDDWWRAEWTVVGSGLTIDFVVFIAIQ